MRLRLRGGGKPSAPKFTYDGDYVIRDDGVVELLTSGTLVFLNPAVIDIFCVGGGGAGAIPRTSASYYATPGGGGGGGYTSTLKNQNVSGSYDITVGAGSPLGGAEGEATLFGALVRAAGGKSGLYGGSQKKVHYGANGGSGGGGGRQYKTTGGTGGSNGSNGVAGVTEGDTTQGGAGQGTTTREFQEENGKLYAGGGGGGTYVSSSTPVQAPGGEGGGGAGGWTGTSTNQGIRNANPGVANAGGGGGGGVRFNSSYSADPGAGGSGIVCFRVAK